MSGNEVKKAMFKTSRNLTGCDQHEWARLFNLGQNKGQSNISAKESGTRGANMSDLLAGQLAEFLYSKGYDVKYAVFDTDGRIVDIPLLIE